MLCKKRESIEGRIYLKELELLAMVAGKPKIYRAFSAHWRPRKSSGSAGRQSASRTEVNLKALN